jgi:energy-coupling factor transporter transmembrane protein EcfT
LGLPVVPDVYMMVAISVAALSTCSFGSRWPCRWNAAVEWVGVPLGVIIIIINYYFYEYYLGFDGHKVLDLHAMRRCVVQEGLHQSVLFIVFPLGRRHHDHVLQIGALADHAAQLIERTHPTGHTQLRNTPKHRGTRTTRHDTRRAQTNLGKL